MVNGRGVSKTGGINSELKELLESLKGTGSACSKGKSAIEEAEPAQPLPTYESNYTASSHEAVKQTFQDLKALIDGLSGSVSKIVTVQEQEFVASYRVHMLNVALELKELKAKINSEEMYNDTLMSQVEEGCNWYRQQAKLLKKEDEHLQHEIEVVKLQDTVHI